MVKHHYRIETLYASSGIWGVCTCWRGMTLAKAEGAWMVLKAFSDTSTRKYRLVRYPLPGNAKTPGEVVDECPRGQP